MPLITESRNSEEAASRQLQRTIECEERRRNKRARALTGAGVLVLLGVALISGVLTVHALRRPASAAAISQSLEEPLGPAPRSAAVSGPAGGAATHPTAKALAEPSKPAITPKKQVAPRKAGSTKSRTKVSSANSPSAAAPQRFAIAIGRVGYEPASITAQAGRPILITVGKGEGCAAGFNISKLGVHADNSAGPATIDLGKVKAGTYTYSCSMGMVSGKLVVR